MRVQARSTEDTMEHGDNNQMQTDRSSQTGRELKRWRAGEKPSSGAPAQAREAFPAARRGG